MCYILKKKLRVQGYQMCIISISAVNHQCTITDDSSAHHQCIISASSVNHQCIILTSSEHRQCIISRSIIQDLHGHGNFQKISSNSRQSLDYHLNNDRLSIDDQLMIMACRSALTGCQWQQMLIGWLSEHQQIINIWPFDDHD